MGRVANTFHLGVEIALFRGRLCEGKAHTWLEKFTIKYGWALGHLPMPPPMRPISLYLDTATMGGDVLEKQK